jgi:hypothetical protein
MSREVAVIALILEPSRVFGIRRAEKTGGQICVPTYGSPAPSIVMPGECPVSTPLAASEDVDGRDI